MKTKIIYISFSICIILLYGCSGGSRPDTSGTGNDKYKHIILVNKARAYLSGGPEWFLPPNTCFFGAGDGTNKNTSGAVAYGIDIYETLSSFREKIKNASEEGQTTWLQYTCVNKPIPCGFLFGYCAQSPTAGMVCQVLVLNALRDAGYSVSNQFLDLNHIANTYAEVTGVKRIGDIVLYEFEENGIYDGKFDHVGILSGNTHYADPKDFLVIHIAEYVNYFNLGAAETRLGVFDVLYGTNYKIKFVRPE